MPSALLTALVMLPAAAKIKQIRAKNGAACGGNMSSLLLSRCLWGQGIEGLSKYAMVSDKSSKHSQTHAKCSKGLGLNWIQIRDSPRQ